MEKFDKLVNNKIFDLLFRMLVIFFAIATAGIAVNMYRTYVFDGAKSIRYNLFVGISLVCMLVAVLYIARLIISKKNYTYERLFLVVGTCFGIAMQIVMPCFSGPDENVHFLSAYNASYFYEAGLIDDHNMTLRDKDGDYYLYFLSFPEEYELLANGQWFGYTREEAAERVIPNENIYFIRYITSGFGMFLARKFRFGLVGLMYAGRMMNTLFMLVVGYWCVKLTPYGKAQMIALVMMPQLLELCNSYSYDCNSILLATLFAVLCMRFSQEENKLELKHLVLMFFTAALLIPNKAVYVLYIILLFMIPFSKYMNLIPKYDKGTKEYKRQRYLIGGIAAVMIAFFGWITYHYFDSVFETLFKPAGASVETVGELEAFSLSYIIHNPGETMAMLWRTLKLYGWIDFRNAVGEYLGNHKIAFFLPSVYVSGIIVALALGLIFARTKGAKGIGKRRFTILIIASMAVLAAVVLGSMLRFTPIVAERVQVSYRYFVPLIAVGLVMSGTDKEEDTLTLLPLFVQSIFCTGALCYVIYHLISL